MSNSSSRIAIQSKGRLREASLAWLQERGVVLPDFSDRTLLVEAINLPLEIMFVRHSDIPRYVQAGSAAYGIVGANVLHELEPQVTPLCRFDFGHCRLVIAVPTGSNIKSIADLNGHRIATSYPQSLRKFLRTNGIAAAVIEMSGSVEIAPQLNLADAICDLVQSGNTLKMHNLLPLHTIMESTATLIMSPQYQPTPNDLIYTNVYATTK